jgi:hypothetical protein
MTSPIMIAVALVLLVAVAVRLALPGGRSTLFPYHRKATLFSPAERSFLGVLERAVGNHYRIFGKVRIADVVETKRGLSGSHRQGAFNRINAKHFDFLLCDKQSLSVVCAIELDDKSHQRSSRQQRDAFVTELCRNVGLPLLRTRASKGYSVQELRLKILEVTQRKLEPSLSPVPPLAPRSVTLR